MKKTYLAYVNGKDVFIDTKIIERIAAKGITKSLINITLFSGVITAGGVLACYAIGKRKMKKEQEQSKVIDDIE